MIIKLIHKTVNLSATIDNSKSEQTKTVEIIGDKLVVDSLREVFDKDFSTGWMESIPEELLPYISKSGRRIMKHKDGYIKNIFIPQFSDIYNIEIIEE